MTKNYILSKFSFLCIIFMLSALFTNCQTLQAFYKIKKDLYASIGNEPQKFIVSLKYDGFLYHQGGRNIFYKKPLYLTQYPDGVIHFQTGEKSQYQIGLVTDTLQGISYIDTDSLVERQRVDIGGSSSFNLKRKLKLGREAWTLLPDKKEVNGLSCQKAQWVNPNGVLQWEVWFCADIPVFVGPGSITDLPGLVVEAENKIRNETYTLESYSVNTTLPINAFWPNEFNQPFK